MTGIGRNGFQMAFIVLCALSAQTAAAQWLPQWSTPWQHPEPNVDGMPLRLSGANDGSTFAAAAVNHHILSHLALVRFNSDGTFAWLQEHGASAFAGIALMGANRIAIAGDGGAVAIPVDVRLYDTETGGLIWNRQAGGGHLASAYDTPQLAVDAGGNLMVLASDHGDYVVIRFDIDGNALPTWRYEVDAQRDVVATAIVALPDGGAVITGRTASDVPLGPNVTVRLDASGNPVFTDIQMPGPVLGLFTFGAAHLGLDNDGNIIVAAARESGSTLAQVWKVSSAGARLWTTYLPDPISNLNNTTIGGFALSADGNPLIALATNNAGGFHLLRLDGATGAILSNTKAPIGGQAQTVAVAKNGRILLSGAESFSASPTYARMAEFSANGEPCRVSGNTGIFGGTTAIADANGWRVLGTAAFVQGVGTAATLSQFDFEGDCTLSDSVFADGFEPETP